MQPSADSTDTIVKGVFAARKIVDDLSWGVGAIQPPAGGAPESDLVTAVVDSLTEVNGTEEAYSACTDGRLPVRLLNGRAVPVREQLVGADTVCAFYVAECLGDRFYKDPLAPVADRVREVATFLQHSGIMPSTHIGCGAAISFVIICENIVRFNDNDAYRARLQSLLPEGVFSGDLHGRMLQTIKQRLDGNAYEGLSPDIFVQAVEDVAGDQAVAELRDDGRGIHGHVEEAIVRLHVPGYAIDENKLAGLTHGREVFGVNDDRLERIARLFARGNDDDYRLAYMALEDFTDCGHGTLAKNLPTYIITKKP